VSSRNSSRLDVDGLTATARYTVLERLETAARRQSAVSHTVVAGLEQLPGWPAPHIALSDVLRISRAEARNRVRDAAQLTPRRSLTGQPLPPLLPATATAWHAGILDANTSRSSNASCANCRRHRPGADRHRRAHPG
jgi:hypothetical protein